MKVDVYRNLNEDCLSMKSRESEDYGIVVSHEQQLTVEDVEFVVQPSGLREARETGSRNVHAFVRGELRSSVELAQSEPVTYNPFEYDYFVHRETERPVKEADLAVVSTDGVQAKNLTYHENE